MQIRKAQNDDKGALLELYQQVSRNERGIARTKEEITEQYINRLFESVQMDGLMLVGVEEGGQTLIAEVHAVKYGIKIFDHIFTNLTIVVHPDYQQKGLGKKLFQAFLDEVKNNRPEIGRIELEFRASNQRSVALYSSLGFVQEGVMKNKTKNKDGGFEDSLLMAWTNPDFKF